MLEFSYNNYKLSSKKSSSGIKDTRFIMCSSRASERDKRLNQSSPSAWNLAETTLSF